MFVVVARVHHATVGYHDTISKARELLLLFRRADMPITNVNHLLTSHNEERLRGVKEALQQMSQQLASLSIRQPPNAASRMCFNCGQPGHIARNCRLPVTSQVECFNCGRRGHIARSCRQQGNDQGGPCPSQVGKGPCP